MCPPAVSYDRILSIQSLSDIPNPWKGVTMNRCLVLTLTVLLMSAGMNQLHCECYREINKTAQMLTDPLCLSKCPDAVDAFLEETGVRTFVGSVQDGSFAQVTACFMHACKESSVLSSNVTGGVLTWFPQRNLDMLPNSSSGHI